MQECGCFEYRGREYQEFAELFFFISGIDIGFQRCVMLNVTQHQMELRLEWLSARLSAILFCQDLKNADAGKNLTVLGRG